jgi:hypothetical protein
MRNLKFFEGINDSYIGDLIARLYAEGIYPDELIAKAYRIFKKRISRGPVRKPDTYFLGIIRRLVFSRRNALDPRIQSQTRRKFLLASIIKDLQQAGLSEGTITEKLKIGYRKNLPPETVNCFLEMLKRRYPKI